jgi:hypothetical protein
MWQFPLISSEVLHFCLYEQKIKDTFKKFQKLSVVHTTFSQTQTGAAVP